MDLIFFGMQGSGKGTLGKAVAERYNMVIFETGGELRKLATEDSELAAKVKSIIEAGNLVPNEVVMEIVENFMNHLEPNKNILFDGIPRKIEQAKSLNAILDKHNRHYKAVFLDISRSTALERLASRKAIENRADDTDEAIKRRLEAYENETLPAIELYKEKMIRLNGEPAIEEVRDKAFEVLDPIMKA